MDFAATVEVHRMQEDEHAPLTGFTADVTIRCAECDEPFRFIGSMPSGLSPREPSASVDRTELRLPIAPISAPEGWGTDGPGFTIRGDFDPRRAN